MKGRKKEDFGSAGLVERLELCRLAFGSETVRATVDWHRNGFTLLSIELPHTPVTKEEGGEGEGESSLLNGLIREDKARIKTSDKERLYYG